MLTKVTFFFLWRCDPTRAMASSFLRFLDHTLRTTVGRTPLDEWSARLRDFYLTTHTAHNRQTSMLLVGFEPTISAGERSQTYALDRTATGTGINYNSPIISYSFKIHANDNCASNGKLTIHCAKWCREARLLLGIKNYIVRLAFSKKICKRFPVVPSKYNN